MAFELRGILKDLKPPPNDFWSKLERWYAEESEEESKKAVSEGNQE